MSSPDPAYRKVDSEDVSTESSAAPSAPQSRPTSSGGPVKERKERGRVRFNSSSGANDGSSYQLRAEHHTPSPPRLPTVPKATASPAHSRNPSGTILKKSPPETPEHEKGDPFSDSFALATLSPTLKPVNRRPSVLRNNSYGSYNGDLQKLEEEHEHYDLDGVDEKHFSALAAQERAQRIASLVGSHSAPSSRRTSLEDDEEDEMIPRPTNGLPVRIDDIPLTNMSTAKTGRESVDDPDDEALKTTSKSALNQAAHRLVRVHTRMNHPGRIEMPALSAEDTGFMSGPPTPNIERGNYDAYVERPEQYRGGVLSSLLKLYKTESMHPAHGAASPGGYTTPGSSGTSTPAKAKLPKWYHQRGQSNDTLANLIGASAVLGAPGATSGPTAAQTPSRRPKAKRSSSSKFLDAAHRLRGPRLADEIKITIHIANILARQRYLIKLCRLLMECGAPSHRLEEYMKMSARILEIDGQFLYIYNCMLISFDDASTHTTEVKFVKAAQGVNLGKLKDVHDIYKGVVHDKISLEEATERLDDIINEGESTKRLLFRIFMYGVASLTVGPFAYTAGPRDLPICFMLGCIVGILQLYVAPKSPAFQNVFEVGASVITSFLARAFGSIPYAGGQDGRMFCFPALAQSAITLILPGFVVLSAALELQSRSIIAGSVRMVYAIIYSLFLGFGITIGTALYGLMDDNATTAQTCTTGRFTEIARFPSVAAFTLCLAAINNARLRQYPAIFVISVVGYIVEYYSAQRFASDTQIANTLGALTIGVLANLYSRIRHGVAVAAMLPAIFVQVPSGLAASGSLIAGLQTAESITNPNGTSTTVTTVTSGDTNTIVFNVGFQMIQIAIGISVGLFFAGLIIYPLGKRRSGLFSF